MTQNLDRVKELLGNRRAKALIVAVLILITVVVMQVGNLQKQKPMCELLGNCKLRNIDLHRMQIALSKSGLSEFEIEGKRILVPKANRSAYLQAIADQKAIPPELRSGEQTSSVPNPFLSRSQQQLIERESKKRQIQQMVVRLPFVEQAWFEMDVAESRSTFTKSKKSAVISIRPVAPNNLIEQHVDTVRQMIAGAVAGIDPNQIVVIDLNTGFAHRHAAHSEPMDQRLDAQRVAYARQQMLENRIRQALEHYPDLRVTVIVEEVEDENQLADGNSSRTNLNKQGHVIPATISAGANGQASIYEIPIAADSGESIGLTTSESVLDSKEHVTVVIDVPQTLLASIYGDSATVLKMSEGVNIANNDKIDADFAMFQTEIQQLVRPLLGSDVQPTITFNLIRQPLPPANQWGQRVQEFTKQNWPSIAVLLIGMVLIYLITQSDNAADLGSEETEPSLDADILAINSDEHRELVGETKRAAEIRLSELIDKNPDAAAKVIQNWIRDAA
jgi:flagellar M-ring protein FliF